MGASKSKSKSINVVSAEISAIEVGQLPIFFTRLYIYIHTYICLYIYIYVFINIYLFMYIYIYIYLSQVVQDAGIQ